MKTTTAAIAFAILVSVAARAAEPDTYLFDVLTHGQYHAAFVQLLRGKTVPDWVKAVVKSGEGVAVPNKTIEIAGKSYRLDHVCKVHDCAGNVLAVLWAQGGRQVWAGLVENAGTPVWFGKPTPDQAQALTAALKGS